MPAGKTQEKPVFILNKHKVELKNFYLNSSVRLSLFLLALLILCLLFAQLLDTGLLVEVKSHQAKKSGHQRQTHEGEHVVDHFLPRRLLHQRHHLHLELKSSITYG